MPSRTDLNPLIFSGGFNRPTIAPFGVNNNYINTTITSIKKPITEALPPNSTYLPLINKLKQTSPLPKIIDKPDFPPIIDEKTITTLDPIVPKINLFVVYAGVAILGFLGYVSFSKKM
jgi:hypothetical protein